MRVFFAMLLLLTLATALVSLVPDPPPPPPPFEFAPFEDFIWHIERYGDCYGRDPFTFNQRCPEFI